MWMMLGMFTAAIAGELTLTAQLDGVDVARGGTLRCALWKGEDGWPTKDAKAFARVEVQPAQGQCVFPDLEPGTYAVSVLHDEDGDGVLATNVFGIPREGWATTRNVKPALRGPTFAESKVSLTADRRFSLTVHY